LSATATDDGATTPRKALKGLPVSSKTCNDGHVDSELGGWPLNLLMHQLTEQTIANGNRSFRKHRAIEFPFGL
jgi:hypothetical protein